MLNDIYDWLNFNQIFIHFLFICSFGILMIGKMIIKNSECYFVNFKLRMIQLFWQFVIVVIKESNLLANIVQVLVLFLAWSYDFSGTGWKHAFGTLLLFDGWPFLRVEGVSACGSDSLWWVSGMFMFETNVH